MQTQGEALMALCTALCSYIDGDLFMMFTVIKDDPVIEDITGIRAGNLGFVDIFQERNHIYRHKRVNVTL